MSCVYGLPAAACSSRTPEAERAYVVTFDGRVYKTLSLSAGEYSEQMPQGSYIIQIGKTILIN